MPLLQKRHADVELSREELSRIALWIDCNSVFYGVYDPAEQARQLAGEIVALRKCSDLGVRRCISAFFPWRTTFLSSLRNTMTEHCQAHRRREKKGGSAARQSGERYPLGHCTPSILPRASAGKERRLRRKTRRMMHHRTPRHTMAVGK